MYNQIAIQPQHIKSRNQSPAHHLVGVGLHAQPGLSGYDYKTNHRKPSQTTTNYRKPPQTTANDHKPPPEFETIGGENDEKQANHRKPLQTTTRIRVKKESNCQFCGLNLAMARRNIIYLCHSCRLHGFSICKQLFYIEKHCHVCNNQDWVCVAPPIEYVWCQFKMTSSKCPSRSKHQVIILT